MRAARWMQVPPWELMDKPVMWREWALMADRAESDAAEFKQLEMMKRMLG